MQAECCRWLNPSNSAPGEVFGVIRVLSVFGCSGEGLVPGWKLRLKLALTVPQ